MADSEEAFLSGLFANNRAWAEKIEKENPGFFDKLARQQAPRVLWIGCSDSRVPANEITGMLPGEVFVHRNVANQVMMVDFNCLAVLQYAVEALRVRHVVVCGHYGCGGVKASLKNHELGLLDNWLYGINVLSRRYEDQIVAQPHKAMQVDALCEINVIEQVRNVCRTTIVKNAWRRGQDLSIHGWIYGIQDGLLHDLGATISEAKGAEQALADLLSGPRLRHRAA
ncbi:MAG: carbonate dehydratase [Reyranella sp.]|jgi:carbonic anhydrase|nr:carbonate dehydratase [Reyranella sp.]